MRLSLLSEGQFTTSQGSTYSWDGQRTARNKTKHLLHDKEDHGQKPASDITVFVSPQIAQEIGMHGQMNREAQPRTSLDPQNNKIILTSKWGKGPNGELYHKTATKEFPCTRYPEIGLCPVEFWLKNGITTSYHAGNPITDVQT